LIKVLVPYALRAFTERNAEVEVKAVRRGTRLTRWQAPTPPSRITFSRRTDSFATSSTCSQTARTSTACRD